MIQGYPHFRKPPQIKWNSEAEAGRLSDFWTLPCLGPGAKHGARCYVWIQCCKFCPNGWISWYGYSCGFGIVWEHINNHYIIIGPIRCHPLLNWYTHHCYPHYKIFPLLSHLYYPSSTIPWLSFYPILLSLLSSLYIYIHIVRSMCVYICIYILYI